MGLACVKTGRYKRTRNFEPCGRAESKKTKKFVFRSPLRTNSVFVFAQPGSRADVSITSPPASDASAALSAARMYASG
jgi:hypothetical protein